MTKNQKQLRNVADELEKIEMRCAEILSADEMNEGAEKEIKELAGKKRNLIEKRQALGVLLDADDAAAVRGEAVDAETRERLELRGRVSVGAYIAAAQEQRGIDAAEAEYNAACGMKAGRFPLHLLTPEVEKRAITDTDAKASQMAWIDRLFNESLAKYCGISFRGVEPGVVSVPITTTGATASQVERTVAKSTTTQVVGVTELKPKRNAAHLIFSLEDSYRLPGLESSIRRDMQMAVMENVDASIFEGGSSQGSATVADITGLNTATGVVEKEITQSNKVKPAETIKEIVELIDGKHATMPADLKIVTSVGANTLWMSQIANSAAENQTLAQFLKMSGFDWRVRGGIDTATSNGKFGAFIGRMRGIEGAATAAVWDEGMLIRDEYTGAAKGEVGLTLNYFWDFQVPRASNFARIKFVSS